jgi:hypothetical protein
MRYFRHNFVSPSLKVELAFAELAEMKRESTMGHAWNSATMFSIIVFIYTVVDLIYLISSEEATACKYWQVYFGLRVSTISSKRILLVGI